MSRRPTATAVPLRVWTSRFPPSDRKRILRRLHCKSVVFELPADLDREVPGRVVELSRGRAVIVDTRSRRAALDRLADVVEQAAAAFAEAAARAA